jgi:hypothetical protein
VDDNRDVILRSVFRVFYAPVLEFFSPVILEPPAYISTWTLYSAQESVGTCSLYTVNHLKNSSIRQIIGNRGLRRLTMRVLVNEITLLGEDWL